MSLYYCDVCRLYMTTSRLYYRHLISYRHNRLEQERTDYQMHIDNQCVCGRIFTKQSSLNRHYKSCIHNPEKRKKARSAMTAELQNIREEMEQQKLQQLELRSDTDADADSDSA